MQNITNQDRRYGNNTEGNGLPAEGGSCGDRTRISAIDHYYETREYRLAPLGLKQHLRRSSLSSGARECFDLLLDESTFSHDWSTQVSRADIAEELRKEPNSITRLLLELEKAGYIIRKLNPSQASTIYINFPEDAIAALEVSNVRRSKRKAIQECGTIIDQSDVEKSTEVSNFRSPQKRVDDLPKIVSPTLYNTKQYNNNNKYRDLASDATQKNSESNSNSSVVVSSHDSLVSAVSEPEPIETPVLSTELSELDSQISSLNHLLELERATKSKKHVASLEKQLLDLQQQSLEMQMKFQDCKVNMGYESKQKVDSVESLAHSDLNSTVSLSSHRISSSEEVGKIKGNPKINLFKTEEIKIDPSVMGKKAVIEEKIKKLDVDHQEMFKKIGAAKGSGNADDISRLYVELKDVQCRLTQSKVDLKNLVNKQNPAKDIVLAKNGRKLEDAHVDKIKKIVRSKNSNEKQAELVFDSIKYNLLEGSLANKISYKTGKVMSLDFCVNTACDLVEQGRWRMN